MDKEKDGTQIIKGGGPNVRVVTKVKKKPKKKLTPQEKKEAMLKNARIVFFNLLGMVAVVFLIIYFGLLWVDGYVNHGEEVEVPDLRRMHVEDAKAELRSKGFSLEIHRYDYRAGAVQDEVLEQSPKQNTMVKEGRKVYVVLNTTQKPKQSVPGVIDNCSLREAQARISAAGFVVAAIDTVAGEKDWVYELRYKNRQLSNGEAIPQGSAVTIVIGSGKETQSDTEVVVDDDYFE